MKQISGIFLSLVLLLSLLCGCQMQTDSYLQPVKLTESERDLLQLTHQTLPLVMDYHVEGAKFMSIDRMTLQDGQWVSEETQIFSVINEDASQPMQGRMALNYSTESDNFGLTSVAAQLGDGTCLRSAEFSNSSTYELRSAAANQNESTVTLNQPVYLLIFCADKPGNISNGAVATDPLAHPEAFASDDVQMITVTFSDKEPA